MVIRMEFQFEVIVDKLPEQGCYQINKRRAVRAVIRRGEEILLVSTNQGDYKFPGGGIEAGESEEEALLREICEETGYVDVEIGTCIGTTFEQNIDTEITTENTFFQMESKYYECFLKSEKRVVGSLDDYEEKLGFKPKFISLEEVCASQDALIEKGMEKEIPWLLRETKVLHKLQKSLVDKIADVMRVCGKIMLEADRSGTFIDEKEGHANFVTTYDKKVQEELQKRLLQILPEAHFVGEEEINVEMNVSGEASKNVKADASQSSGGLENGYAFIVDPIDGTTNFIKDYKNSAISVGLLKDGEPFIGCVYQPYLDEMFMAEKGKGAFCNGKPIHVSKQPLSNGIVLFGTAPYYEELNRSSFEMAYNYFKQALDIRRSGSAALDLCSIAAGRAELYFEMKLSPWDYAAGALIVTEAGGIVTTIDGAPLTFEKGCSVLARNQ